MLDLYVQIEIGHLDSPYWLMRYKFYSTLTKANDVYAKYRSFASVIDLLKNVSKINHNTR